MKLVINKSQFVESILAPVSKLADNLLLDFTSPQSDGMYAKTFISSADNSMILIANVPCKADNPYKCVIPDCKTFLRLFSGVEKEDIALDIDTNVIKYKDHSFSFKYHLLDESYIVNKKSISEEKINGLTFDTTFTITKQKLSEIIKFNSIVPDAEKLYFLTDGTKVFAKLGDEQKSNTNEIITELAESFTGQSLSDSFPINIQNVLLFSFCSDEIEISVNHQLKVFQFKTPNLKYIVSGLVK
jgi:dimeric dUTPase (all-alpha-NTP-PPase superfamily)